jgi:hypothetical protein
MCESTGNTNCRWFDRIDSSETNFPAQNSKYHLSELLGHRKTTLETGHNPQKQFQATEAAQYACIGMASQPNERRNGAVGFDLCVFSSHLIPCKEEVQHRKPSVQGLPTLLTTDETLQALQLADHPANLDARCEHFTHRPQYPRMSKNDKLANFRLFLDSLHVPHLSTISPGTLPCIRSDH